MCKLFPCCYLQLILLTGFSDAFVSHSSWFIWFTCWQSKVFCMLSLQVIISCSYFKYSVGHSPNMNLVRLGYAWTSNLLTKTLPFHPFCLFLCYLCSYFLDPCSCFIFVVFCCSTYFSTLSPFPYTSLGPLGELTLVLTQWKANPECDVLASTLLQHRFCLPFCKLRR